MASFAATVVVAAAAFATGAALVVAGPMAALLLVAVVGCLGEVFDTEPTVLDFVSTFVFAAGIVISFEANVEGDVAAACAPPVAAGFS